jgi:hypothetical protein
MSNEHHSADPLQFMKGMWGNMNFGLPGMITPTLDTEELEKRITDLKAVEGWLRMNLSMLQLTIQNLEMQKSTLTAVRTLNDQATPAADAAAQAFSQAAMWPWSLMSQMQQHMAQSTNTPTDSPPPSDKPTPTAKRNRKS